MIRAPLTLYMNYSSRDLQFPAVCRHGNDDITPTVALGAGLAISHIYLLYKVFITPQKVKKLWINSKSWLCLFSAICLTLSCAYAVTDPRRAPGETLSGTPPPPPRHTKSDMPDFGNPLWIQIRSPKFLPIIGIVIHFTHDGRWTVTIEFFSKMHL